MEDTLGRNSVRLGCYLVVRPLVEHYVRGCPEVVAGIIGECHPAALMISAV